MTTNTVAQAKSAARAVQTERRSELDVMGMLVVLGLVFFHTGQIFESATDFFVKSEPQSTAGVMIGMLLVSFASLWGMPLMMLIAGIAIWYSLRKRTAGEFVLERIQRLFVSFVVGLVVLLPPQSYLGVRLDDPTYRESYWRFLPRFFNVRFDLRAFPLFVKAVPPDNLFKVSILWFLIYLFVYTLLLLPFLLYLRRPAGQRLVERWASFFTRPWAIYLLALPIALIEAGLTTEWPGGWNRFVWFFFLFYGFLSASDKRLGQILQRHRKSALVLGIVIFLVYYSGTGYLFLVAEVVPWTDYSPVGLAVRFLKGMASWVWVVAIMGIAGYLGQRGTRRSQQAPMSSADSRARSPDAPGRPTMWDRLAAYAKEAQLPFYVLHQLPIVVIGYFVVQWKINAFVMYVVISLGALVTTLVLYDIAVRRTAVTRFLFGMRPKQRAPLAPSSKGGVHAD